MHIYILIIFVQGCQNKYREIDGDVNLGPPEIAAVKHRTEAVSYALLAGMMYVYGVTYLLVVCCLA